MKNAILLPARDISRDASAHSLKTLLDYLKGHEAIVIEEGDEVEKEIGTFSRLIEERYERPA
jgi:hypothetical protein